MPGLFFRIHPWGRLRASSVVVGRNDGPFWCAHALGYSQKEQNFDNLPYQDDACIILVVIKIFASKLLGETEVAVSQHFCAWPKDC